MGEVDPILYMLDLTDSLLSETGAINDESFGSMAPGSVAERECDESELGSAVLNAYYIGSSQISAAMDFISGVVHLCRPEVRRYSVFAVARAALEASSRAWWIMDDKLPPQERALRGLKERCRGLRERLRLERAMGESRMPAMRRMVEVRAEARRLGLHGRIGQPPTVTDLFEKAFTAAGLSVDEGAFAMKHLSAYVHVTPSALLSQMASTPPTAALSDLDPRLSLRTPSINPSELAYAIDSTAKVFALAYTKQIKNYGWDEKRWSDIWGQTAAGLRRATAHILEAGVPSTG